MRESNIGTKIFEVGFVPSREVAPVDDDLGFQEELDHQNTTVSISFIFKCSGGHMISFLLGVWGV